MTQIIRFQQQLCFLLHRCPVGELYLNYQKQLKGHDALNKCMSFSKTTVNDETKPVIKVCGSQTKVTVFLRNRCVDYHEYSMEIGVCDTKAATDACETKSPATDKWLMTAQSYKITQCATGTQA